MQEKNLMMMQKSEPKTKMIYSKPPTTRSEEVNQVHLVLQGKGGIGKSVVACLVSQYLRSKNTPMQAIDIDPVTATLYGYKGLGAKKLRVISQDEILIENFDTMMEEIVSGKKMNFVIDNGASGFLPFINYIIRNDIINILSENGKEVYVHTVIKAGQELVMTVAGFESLAQQLPVSAKIVVWLNEFTGEIIRDGKTFDQMKVYQRNKDRVHSIVKLEPKHDTEQGRDVKRMLNSWLTFDEVDISPDFGVIPKARLRRVRDSIYSQLEKALQH